MLSFRICLIKNFNLDSNEHYSFSALLWFLLGDRSAAHSFLALYPGNAAQPRDISRPDSLFSISYPPKYTPLNLFDSPTVCPQNARIMLPIFANAEAF